MVERIDYFVQILAAFAGCAMAAVSFSKMRKLSFLLLGGFFITFGMGNLYLLLHIVLTGDLPFFYTGELAWTASYLFLLALYAELPSVEERRFFAPAALVAPLVCAGFCVYYIDAHGDPLGNLLMCVPTALLGYFSLRGLLYGTAHRDEAGSLRLFHGAVLALVILEYCLWTWSCFWVSDTLSNPYFWCDFLISAEVLLLVPAVRKAVAA